MIVSGYYGELVVTGDLTLHWLSWSTSLGLCCYIWTDLLVGLAEATNNDGDDHALWATPRNLIQKPVEIQEYTLDYGISVPPGINMPSEIFGKTVK